jgi:hypothetical protein
MRKILKIKLLVLIGDSGGFLLNIRPGKFVNTELFNEEHYI